MASFNLPLNVGKTSSFTNCQESCDCIPPPLPPVKEEELETDPRLKNWEKWLKERHRVHKILSKVTDRPSGDLLMNAYEDYRCTKEQMLVFEYCKIKKPHPVLGCPSFWKPPLCLINREDPTLDTPYVPALTYKDRCIIPDIEYVKVPIPIKAIKGVYPKSREGHDSWSKNEYKEYKLRKLRKKLKVVQPHKPDLDYLMLFGTKIERPKPPEEEVICEQNNEQSSFKKDTGGESYDHIFIFNYLPIFTMKNGTFRANLVFYYNMSSERIVTDSLKLENTSDVTLRIRFSKIVRKPLFSDLISAGLNNPQVFFFNKNELIMAPEDLKILKVHCKCPDSGYYSENWELKFLPNIFEGKRLIICMQAFADWFHKAEKCQKIKDDLNNKTRAAVIEKSLHRQPTVRNDAIVFTYDKRRLFEAINSPFDPYHHTPKYRYNKEVIDKLEEIFQLIRLPKHPKVWNLCLYDLKVMAVERELIDEEMYKVNIVDKYYRELVKSEQTDKKNYEQLFNRPTTCISPPKEPEIGAILESLLEKHMIGKSHVNIRYTTIIEELISKLVKPLREPNAMQPKFERLYTIFCAHMDYLMKEVESLKNRFGIKQVSTYPTIEAPPFFCERQTMLEEDTHIRKTLRDVGFYPPRGQVDKDEVLAAIPLEDYKLRHKIYFKIPDPPSPPSPGRKKAAGKTAKAAKAAKRAAKGPPPSTPEPEIKYRFNVDKHFYPLEYQTKQPVFNFAEEIDLSQEDGEEEEEEEFIPEESNEITPIPYHLLHEYRYNLYLLFYTFLENAIMSLIDFVDCYQEEITAEEVLEIEKCRECGIHYTSKTMETLRLVNLKAILATEDMQDVSYNEPAEPFQTKLKRSENLYVTEDQDSVKSLFSILQPYQSEPEITKPVSYPQEDIKIVDEEEKYYPKIVFDSFTETAADEPVDPDWVKYVEIGLQKDILVLKNDPYSFINSGDMPKSPSIITKEAEVQVDETHPEPVRSLKISKKKSKVTPVELGYLPEYVSKKMVFYDTPQDERKLNKK